MWVFACGGGDDDAVVVDAAPIDGPAIDGPVVDASTSGRVQATVNYTGSAQGSLVLAAFASMPPMGPPMGFAQAATPVFPASLAIENLAPGTVHVLALLVVAPASPTQPGPEDRQVWSGPLTLTAGATTTTTLTLIDP
jgi:hypothetical protein